MHYVANTTLAFESIEHRLMFIFSLGSMVSDSQFACTTIITVEGNSYFRFMSTKPNGKIPYYPVNSSEPSGPNIFRIQFLAEIL